MRCQVFSSHVLVSGSLFSQMFSQGLISIGSLLCSGKSTVGRLLSKNLQYAFFDTDSLVEQAANKSIPDIFAEEGEDEFRTLETQVGNSYSVIATFLWVCDSVITAMHLHTTISSGPLFYLAAM